MKALLTIITLCLPLLMISQSTDSLAIVAKKTAEIVLKEQRSIDSIRQLKEVENSKQISLLRKIQKRIAFLKAEKKISVSNDYKITQSTPQSNAIKPNNDIIYWEEVRRKWTGRLFNKDSIRVRIFRFENGEKVYLD